MKNKIYIPMLVVAALVVGTVYVTSVEAQEVEDTPKSTMIDRFVEYFNLNEDEVQQYVEDVREEKHAEMSETHEAYLDEAVASGDLTEAQKALILEKKEELRATHDQMKTELQEWSDANDIDLQYLRPHKAKGFHKMHGGFGGRKGFHPDGSSVDASALRG